MTTFEQTWQIDPNRSPANESTHALQSRSIMWWIKAFLKGEQGGATQGLWTCAGSSDAATAGMDGVDRWTASFDSTKIVRATPGNAHSWIVLQSPAGLGGGPWYMCIDYSATVEYQTSVFFSKTAFTGGSTTARPTSTTEWAAPPGGTTPSQFIITSLQGVRMNGLLSTSGDFHIRFSRQSGSGFMNFAFSFIALTNTKSTDAHNGWSLWQFLDGSPGVCSRPAWSTSSGWPWRGRNKDNTVTVDASIIAPHIGATHAFADISGTDGTDNLYGDFPMYLQVVTAAQKSQRGRIRDLMWAPDNAPNQVEPPTGPPYQSVILGAVWHPWPASVTPAL